MTFVVMLAGRTDDSGQESEYNKEQSGPVFPPFPPQNRMSPVAAQDKRMLPADEGESVRVRRACPSDYRYVKKVEG